MCRSVLCGGVCGGGRRNETGRDRVCGDGRITVDTVQGEACRGELCVGGYGECCLGLASGSGEESFAGTQIETQNNMEEDWIRTEPGTQMKLKGLTVHSVQ